MNADYMILNCDARDVPLPDESVHLIVTSPPYWGLRKYAGEQELVWGGDGSCLHEWEATDTASPLGWEMCSSCKVAMPAKLYRRLPKVDVQIDDKVITKRQCGCGSTDWMSHFAAFPQKLIEPMVKAGTSEYGCCSNYGAPWKRDIEKGEPVLANAWSAAGAGQYDDSIGEMKRTGLAEGSTLKHHVPIKTLGWQLTCKCTDSTVEPCTVFDPFTGSGTSAIVACKLGRKFIGTELSDDYVCLAEQRIAYILENE